MTNTIPNKQPGIDHNVYADFAGAGECDRLLRGLCPRRCTDANGEPWPLEQDHIIPRAYNGPNSLANLRLVCKGYNQSKSDRPDPFYESTSGFFDQKLNEHALRQEQSLKGSGLVASTYRNLFTELPDNLFRIFMVVAWMVGAGKTVGTIGILLKMNEVRRAKYPTGWRIRRVLWLVHQRTLVDSIADELRTELTQHGIVESAPRVKTISSPDDWVIHWDADIIVTCPQAIWDAKGRSLDNNTLRRHMAGFDAIVVDEGHYAVERYMHLHNLAPKTLKFTVTATPFDGKGEFFSQMDGGIYANLFRLFSVSGYKPNQGIFKRIEPVFSLTDQQQIEAESRGQEQDDAIRDLVELAQNSRDPRSILPPLNTEYYEAQAGDGQIKACGVDILPEDDPRAEDPAFNAIRNSAVVNRCIAIAQRQSAIYGYDVHVMVRTGSIPDVIRLARVYSSEEAIAAHGADFAATCVYAGSKGPSLGSPEHPWMLAKKTGGKVQKGSKRLVFVVDIGQFGINQPACAVIGWIDVVYSIIEIVQRLGRAVRERGAMGGAVHVVWDDDQDRDGRFRIALYKAVSYILNMEKEVEDAFLPLTELDDIDSPVTTRVVAPDISKPQKAEITEVIGEALIDNPDLGPDEAYRVVVDKVYGGKEPREEIRNQLNDMIQSIYVDPNQPDYSMHDRFFNIPQCFEAFSYVFSEEVANRAITREDVALEIARCPELREHLKAVELAAYDAGDPEVVQHWQAIAKAQRDKEFQIPKSMLTPHQILGTARRPKGWPKDAELPPEKRNIDNSYTQRLRMVFRRAIRQAADRQIDILEGKSRGEVEVLLDRRLSKAIPAALYTAASRLLGLPDFRTVTIAPVRDHITYMLCTPQVSQAILGQAQGLVLKRLQEDLPGLNKVFAVQIESIINGEANDVL